MSKPVLVTDRLELWRPAVADRRSLFELVQPEAVRRFLGRAEDEAAHFARFVRYAGSWSLYGYGNFVLRERGRREVVGIAGVFHSWRGFGKGLDDVAEAGWILAAEHWGKGYAYEAMRAALAWFDESHGSRRIACMIEGGNEPSLRLADRLDFIRYGEHRDDNGTTLILLERPAAGR